MRRLIIAMLVGCQFAWPAIASSATARSGQVVMGTVLQVTVVAADPVGAKNLASSAIDIARHWDDVLTIWRAEGELAVLNSMAGKGPQRITTDLSHALAAMRRLSRATGGAFDPGVGPLVARYSHPANGEPVRDLPIRILEVLELGDGTASLSPGAALDSGGIGKGIALDAIANALRLAGARGAYLDFGGSSQLAFGTMDDGSPWIVAVSGLKSTGSRGFIQLNGALSTSKSRPIGDETGPIVDPRTRRVVEKPRLATCYASNATDAEACSKAFIVLGWGAYDPQNRPGWEAFYEDDAEFHSSPGFASMVSIDSDARASK